MNNEILILCRDTVKMTIDDTQSLADNELLNCYFTKDYNNSLKLLKEYIAQIIIKEIDNQFIPSPANTRLYDEGFMSDSFFLITSKEMSNYRLYHMFFLKTKFVIIPENLKQYYDDHSLNKVNDYTHPNLYNDVYSFVSKITHIEI